ncbi:hypothetical protein F8160_24325 [Bacillus sp. CH126_4D]|uniref:hypothetical protein n=1 Tax=unclassified Bacillus (in: firmicutes) TaxID=185979 RepID=UPI00124F1339|nr:MULTISPECIES: hypothetical protein [unclassified Bacillus (in: firmicutes)]KAB2460198.1 hypothetical protein F8162_03650 [Bacillus sp. CH140a_4T]KAB2468914.1 hypothetical protein F8160_24325 [Bacillus sp. CH126_4D]
MYIDTLRSKLKKDCRGKAMVRNTGLVHFYIYLANSDDIFTARSSVRGFNEVCGTKVTYNGRTEHIDGSLYNYCIHGWDANQKEQLAKANCSFSQKRFRAANTVKKAAYE